MPYPQTAGELQQFLCSTNWMRDSLIDYARVARPLQDQLDNALASASKRTKRIAAGVAVELTALQRNAFDEMKALLTRSMTLAHPKDGATMCVMSDASDVGWSLLVTQVVSWQPNKEVSEQPHEMLICLSGTFSGSQRNWSIIEKEAYPIVCACDKLSYLLLRPDGFKLYCDHRNLIYVFAPGKEVKKHIRGKLLRWATKLMEYHYEIEHIDGESNVWADMISRWAGNHDPAVRLNVMQLRKRSRNESQAGNPRRRKRPRRGKRKQVTLEEQSTAPPTHQHALRPLDDPDFEWPTWTAICTEQAKHADSKPQQATGDEATGWHVGDKLWIPTKADALIQRMMVVAHCGSQGHRGRDAMLTSLRRLYHIERLRVHVDTFLASCLICKHVKGGKIIPRPWRDTYRNITRNGALHFDFLSLGESFVGDRYLLVLRDEATHFTELTPCSDPTSTVAVEAILAWHCRFGVPPVWISDQGSHFTSEVVAEVCRRLKACHDFTVPYSPWINGSVERANRDIMQVLRALCLEYQVDTHDWTYFVPVLQASLNHSPTPSLGNRAPVELFCGLPPSTPLSFCTDAKQQRIVEVPLRTEAITSWLEELRTSIQELHKPMTVAREQQTLRNKRMQKFARQPNFDVGDYVLRSRVDQKHYDKLLVTWVGPYQVVRADKHSFAVRHLLTGEERDVHPSRLKFYADSSLAITKEFREHVSAQGLLLLVSELSEYRWNRSKKDYEVLVSWKGLESIEDSWESIQQLRKDIPVLLTQFATSTSDHRFLQHVTAAAVPKSHRK